VGNSGKIGDSKNEKNPIDPKKKFHRPTSSPAMGYASAPSARVEFPKVFP
jgi:hypothetical protein